MNSMTPRQVIAEILRDYKHNLKLGMSETQAQEILKAMLVDTLIFEIDKSFALGEKSGRFGAMSAMQFKVPVHASDDGTKDPESLSLLDRISDQP